MASFPSKKKKVPPEVIINTIWISTFLALGIFLGIYYSTGNLVLGAVLGFSAHFVAFAFSGKISKFLTKIMN
jgi:hypothetical protein